MAPHNLVLQPVIQFGAAIHGNSFSGGTPNAVQELLCAQNTRSPSREKVQISSAGLSPGF